MDIIMNAFAGIRPKGGQNPTPLAFFPGVCSGGYLFSSGGPTPTTPPPIFTLLAADRARARTTAAGKTEVVSQISRCSAVQALVNYTFIVYHFGDIIICLEYMNALFLP